MLCDVKADVFCTSGRILSTNVKARCYIGWVIAKLLVGTCLQTLYSTPSKNRTFDDPCQPDLRDDGVVRGEEEGGGGVPRKEMERVAFRLSRMLPGWCLATITPHTLILHPAAASPYLYFFAVPDTGRAIGVGVCLVEHPQYEVRTRNF